MKKIAMFLCVVGIFIFLIGCEEREERSVSGGPTLPGADEIYPTIMVEGELYEWRQGRAILEELPSNLTYYASIEHINEETPVENNQLVAAFDVTGDIYTMVDDNSCVYLVVSTDWMDEAVVVFDKAS